MPIQSVHSMLAGKPASARSEHSQQLLPYALVMTLSASVWPEFNRADMVRAASP